MPQPNLDALEQPQQQKPETPTQPAAPGGSNPQQGSGNGDPPQPDTGAPKGQPATQGQPANPDQAAAANNGSAPAGDTGVEPYKAELFGGQIIATPSAADEDGQRTWKVTAKAEDGVQASINVKLTGQFGPEELTPGSYTKEALQEKLAEKRAEQAPGALELAANALPSSFVVGTERDTRQVLLDLPNRALTVFSTGRKTGKEFLGQPVRELEATTWSMGDSDKGDNTATRRENGWGITMLLGKDGDPRNGMDGLGRLSLNVRGGDTNFREWNSGVSATVTVEMMPKVAEKAAESLSNRGGSKARAVAQVLDHVANAGNKVGAAVGVAYQGTARYNPETQQLELKLSGFEESIPVKSLFNEFNDVIAEPPMSNHGEALIARANNYETYYRGGNPFDNAIATQRNGEFVNHGDPVADLAGRMIEIGNTVKEKTASEPGDYVRTNTEVRTVLERAIEMNQRAPVPKEFEQVAGADEAKPALTPEQSQKLESTLAMMHEYGIAGLYGEAVSQAAEKHAAEMGDDLPIQEGEKEFVQDVFEGKFRDRDEVTGSTDWAKDAMDWITNLNKYAAILWGTLDAPPVADDTTALQTREGQMDGIASRFEAQEGGILQALDIDPAVASSPDERAELEAYAVKAAVHELTAATQPSATAEALYRAYQEMSAEEVRQIGERAVEAYNANVPPQVLEQFKGAAATR